jgi:DNA-directed RNA polymerase subunit RPC12/RpoP
MKIIKCPACNYRNRVGETVVRALYRCGDCGRSFKTSAVDRKSVWITVVSLVLACLGLGISVYGMLSDESPAATTVEAGER